MTDDSTISIENFGASFKNFLEQVATQAPSEEPTFLRHIRNHFNGEPAEFPILTAEFEVSDHPNVQLAIEEYITASDRSAKLVGIIGDQAYAYMGITLSQLLAPARAGLMGGSGLAEGPVQYVNVDLDEQRSLACVQMWLVSHF